MTGRLLFDRFGFLIKAMASFFSFLPRPVGSFLWSLTGPFSGVISVLFRYVLFSSKAGSAGKNIYFGSSVIMKNIAYCKFGSNVSVHDFCYIDAVGGLKIGDNVSIAHSCSIVTFNHSWSDRNAPIKYNQVNLAAVFISDDVWVGCGARIMPGVKIGKRSIVAAGAVVTSDVPSGVIVAGVPARIVKKI
ncbi:MAG: acyltransferase [Methyloprofundus sp.]|nr:acyltransferase [Methyloprofundus sp.]